MKNLIRSKLRKIVVDSINEVLDERESAEVIDGSNPMVQLVLINQYRHMLGLGTPLPKLENVGFGVFSESDEDGILLYLFAILGTTTKKVIDIGAAVGGSNTANLIVNHGWTGWLIEGDREKAESIRTFYKACRTTKNYPPVVLYEWITKDNINRLLQENECEGEIDLLCLDIDGVDYFIWEAIECVSPRVVVVEYQCIWGPEISVSVPYSDNFKGEFSGQFGVYSGASLAAFVKLGEKKGYRLVGCQRYGFNAFFVRDDVGSNVLPEISAKDCFTHPFTKWAQDTLLPEVKDKEWIEI